MTDVFAPFTPGALASLPKLARPARHLRADIIPETEQDEQGQRPTVRDYHAINALPPKVRVPKKVASSVKVEGKVWFANERTWVSWLNTAVLIGTLSIALFNASEDVVARNFAMFYALVSVGVLVYAYALYQHRISMIQRRDPGHFDNLWGPVVVSVLLFLAILANFIIRVKELREKNYPIPGAQLFGNIPNVFRYLSVA